jgi:hypothetical protein
VKQVYFEPMYSINCTTLVAARKVPGLVDRFARPLNYSVYYEPAYYAFRLFDVEIWQPDEERTESSETLKLKVLSKEGHLQMVSDPLDSRFNVKFERIHKYFYTQFDQDSLCSVETGCPVRETSGDERSALVDFY